MVQWLRHCVTTAERVGSIPGWEIKVPHAVQHDQNRKKRKKERSAAVNN